MKYTLRDKKEMKDSGVEWIGEIPESWNVKKIKHLSNIVLGKMLQNEDKGSYILRPYLRAQNITWLSVDVDDVKTMWFSPKEIIKYELQKDDLLVSEGGEVGRTAIWRNELPHCYIQNSINRVRIISDNDPRYYLYSFFAFGKFGVFEQIVNKVSIAHLTREKLKEILFIQPAFDEQKYIADFLDEKTAVIDEVVKKKKKQIELLKEKRAALITQAVTKGLDLNVKMKDSGVEWIGEIPEGWQLIRLRRIVSLNPSKQEAKHIPDDTKVSFLPMAKVSSKGLFDADNVRKKIDVSNGFTYFKNGDVITAKITPCFENGKGALVDGLINGIGFGSTEFIVIRPSDNIDGKYLYHLIHSDLFRKSGEPWMYGSAGQQRVPDRFIKEFEAPLPSIEEQKQIIERLDQKLSMLDEALKKIQKSIQLIQEYRSSLISHAVTGKIVI